MQVQLEVFLEIVFTLFFLKFSTIAFLNTLKFPLIYSLCCLAFLFSSIQFSRCMSVLECTLKIEQ